MLWVYFPPQNRTYCICDTAELEVTELPSDQQKMQIRFHGILAEYSSCGYRKSVTVQFVTVSVAQGDSPRILMFC